MDPFQIALPDDLSADLGRALEDWRTGRRINRLWARDAGLWTDSGEAGWLGWLDVVADASATLPALEEFAQGVIADGIRQVVLLGMGGSSMAPEVIRDTLGIQTGFPGLLVLDSTDPEQLSATEAAIDLSTTLFLVASKSGSTLEPNVLMDYFFQRVADTVGIERAPGQFIAITDPGSSLDRQAGQLGFRHVFPGVPSVGGRFSALSNFGLVPAALIGVNIHELLTRAGHMVALCREQEDPADNPGVLLGLVLGVAARQGHDKLTLVLSPRLASLGAWLEQLVAESTGKQGKCIIPVDGEALAAPDRYGTDRLFVYLRLATAVDTGQDAAIDRLQAGGQPVVRIEVNDPLDLGQEFFRWELATAVAGSIMGVNPFDQPDVEASKVESRRITAACEAGAALPEQPLLASSGDIRIYADPRNAAALRDLCGEGASAGEFLHAHLNRLRAGDYLAILAYLARNQANDAALQGLRQAIRHNTRAATCIGFGPRFLHSTGQAYKGGSNTGVFLQLSAAPVRDVVVPGRGVTFGLIEAAQALGDFEVLAARERRILRVHLGVDVVAGLAQLQRLIQSRT